MGFERECKLCCPPKAKHGGQKHHFSLISWSPTSNSQRLIFGLPLALREAEDLEVLLQLEGVSPPLWQMPVFSVAGGTDGLQEIAMAAMVCLAHAYAGNS